VPRDTDTAPDDVSRREHAAAKLNLFLHVGARAPDGFHPLESLVVFTEFGDRLHLEPSKGFRLRRIGPFADALPAAAADDLTARAVTGLGELVARVPDFTVTLEKNIPVAAGMGGGSADAAAAIRLVCRTWGVPFESPDVLSLAVGLGADVPVCLYSEPAWATGVGEQITPLPGLTDLDLLLVNPRVPLATGHVFGTFTSPASLDRMLPTGVDFAAPAAFLSYLESQRNDLAEPARALCPVIDDVLSGLERQDGCRLARMSGSGPTCFGVFDDRVACERAGAAIGAANPDWWIIPTRTGQPAV